MAADLPSEIVKSWHRLLQDLEMARNYKVPTALIGFGRTVPNPLLDRLLPSLLFVRLLALFDEALEFYIEENAIPWPPSNKRTLFNRIAILRETGRLADPDRCVVANRQRNEIAHKEGKYADWGELDEVVNIIEGELRNLGLVGPRPVYEFYAEKGAVEGSTEPGVAFSFSYSYGLKRDGRKIMEVSWIEKIHVD